MKCPCEECISFAICYQKDVLHCEDLYNYLCKMEVDRSNICSFHGYRYNRGSRIHQLYKRWIYVTTAATREIKLTHNIELRIRSLYERYRDE